MMSFQKFISKYAESKQKIKLPQIEFEVPIHKQYPFLVNLPNYWITLKNIFSLFFEKLRLVSGLDNFSKKHFLISTRPEIIKTSNSSIFIKSTNFKQSIAIAYSYFKVRNKNDLIWKKVYLSRPNKDKPVDGFKFIYTKKEKNIVRYLFEAEEIATRSFLPVEFEVRREGIFFLVHRDVINHSLLVKCVNYLLVGFGIGKNEKLVKKVVKSYGKWVKVGEWTPDNTKDAWLKVEFKKEKLEAYMTVVHPDKRGKIVDIVDVRDLVEKHKIKTGLNWKELEEYLKEKKYETPFLLAKGTPPIPGNDSYFESLSDKDESDEKYRYRVRVYMVEEGQVFLVKHLFTEGQSGVDVLGNIVFTEDGNDVEIKDLAGLNTRVTEDGLGLASMISGSIYFSQGKWSVQEVLELDEVSYKTGVVSHKGMVVVKGSVLDGFGIINATSIIVNESVGACELIAEGDIQIIQGVIGRNQAKVVSNEGSVYARFLQDCEVSVAKDVEVKKLISGSTVEAGDSVRVVEKKGSIWGNNIEAYNEVVADNIGSVSGTNVSIWVGVSLKDRKELESLNKLLHSVNKEIGKVSREMLNKKDPSIKQELNAKVVDLKKRKKNLKESIDKKKKSFKEVTNTPKVSAKSSLLSGVVIKIGNLEYKNTVIKKQKMVRRNVNDVSSIAVDSLS